MTKRVCSQCGKYNAATSVTCSSCGSALQRADIAEGWENICPECGKRLEDDSRICPYCACFINKTTYTAKSMENICPNCGKRLEAGVRTCTSCGCFITRSTKNTITYGRSYETISSLSKGLLYLASCIIPLVGLFAAFFFFTETDPDKKASGKVCLGLAALGIIILLLLISSGGRIHY